MGVAQGSIISPYLFNIYAEDLLIELEQKGWKAKDIYGYADDHLVSSGSPRQLREATNVVKSWSKEYNIHLNPSKCGILEIPPKYGDRSLEPGTMFEGLPVVVSYKYLGVWVDSKLSPQEHLNYLFCARKSKEDGGKKIGKINSITKCLSPCFKNISHDYCTNLWITFIKPLFLPLSAFGPILTNSERISIEAKLRVSLKKFLRLPRNFSVDLLGQIFPINFLEWMKVENENSQVKWMARCERRTVSKEELKKFVVPRVRGLPIEFNVLLKKFVSWCGHCGKPFYPLHLEEHGIQRINVNEIFADLDEIRQRYLDDIPCGKKVNREIIMEAFSIHLRGILDEVDKVLARYAYDFKVTV